MLVGLNAGVLMTPNSLKPSTLSLQTSVYLMIAKLTSMKDPKSPSRPS